MGLRAGLRAPGAYLIDRCRIPRYRYTEEMLEHDLKALKKLGRW